MYNRFVFFLLLTLMFAGTACRKTDFATISSPAYLRVFNCLDYVVTLDNKDAPLPFLTMLVNPVFDAEGIPVSAEIVGDYLDKRDLWARPYPDAANTSVYQKEYPGSLKVLAAPILNGYDLSSWAQIASGTKRVMFYSRPLNTTPFFSLEKNQRRLLLVDTTIDLKAGEIYTMHVLEQDFLNRQRGIYLRNETFVKQPFSDSLVYVNFYNLSSKGFFENTPVTDGNDRHMRVGDTANVFYTLSRFNGTNVANSNIKGHTGIPMGSMIRSLDAKVAPYFSFPLFADTALDKVYTGRVSQLFTFLKPGYQPQTLGFPLYLPKDVYSSLGMGDHGYMVLGPSQQIIADTRSGLIVSVRSGVYNPRSFATINTVEYINAKYYVTTIQRRFDPPVY